MMAVPSALQPLHRLLADRLLTPLLADQLVYWRSQRLYWQGVAHPDGGEREEESEIHAAEGAETAIRRVGDSVGAGSLPGEKLAHALGLQRLRQSLETDERAALKILDRLGPSRRIHISERTHDYMQATDAEMLLDQIDRVHDYLHWLAQTDKTGQADDVGGARA
jgi:hypothetical protein